ncbi:MAG: Gfo/Idh/MocA family protein, partial [bacterium]
STHTWCWSQIGNVKVQAVCDIDTNKAEALARDYNTDSYSSFDSIVKNSDIDIIDICTPTPLHKDMAIDSLKRGKHTLLEKPIARTLKDAREIVEVAKQGDAKFMVAHVVRFFPEYVAAKRLVDNGALGIARMARTKRGGQFPPKRWSDWYRDVEMSGGCIVDTGIHDFDYLRWIFGEVERVFAYALTWKSIDRKDYALVTLRFRSKAMAQCEITWAQPLGTPFRTSFEIIGTDGLVSNDNLESSAMKVLTSKDDRPYIFYESPLAESPYLTEIRHFLSCVEENRDPLVTPEDAYRALEIALAALESARVNRAISIGGDI